MLTNSATKILVSICRNNTHGAYGKPVNRNENRFFFYKNRPSLDVHSKLVSVYRQAPRSVYYLKKTAGTPSGPSIVATRQLELGDCDSAIVARNTDCRETSLKQTCQKNLNKKPFNESLKNEKF